MFSKIVIFVSFFIVGVLLSQDKIDSSNVEFNFNELNSLQTDWNVLTSPVSFYPSNYIEYNNPQVNSLYSMFTSSQTNAGLNIVEPNLMLNQFQLANNWEIKKQYGVFAKYLGIAQFMGVVGLAAIHISKFHSPPKGKINFKNTPKPKTERP
jgi:hypothetical protein